MAHFARLDDDNIVQEVIVVSNDDAPDPYPESEPIGQQFIADVLHLAGVWLQTSYHGTFRGDYAAIGYVYDPATDTFAPAAAPDPGSEP